MSACNLSFVPGTDSFELREHSRQSVWHGHLKLMGRFIHTEEHHKRNSSARRASGFTTCLQQHLCVILKLRRWRYFFCLLSLISAAWSSSSYCSSSGVYICKKNFLHTCIIRRRTGRWSQAVCLTDWNMSFLGRDRLLCLLWSDSSRFDATLIKCAPTQTSTGSLQAVGSANLWPEFCVAWDNLHLDLFEHLTRYN